MTARVPSPVPRGSEGPRARRESGFLFPIAEEAPPASESAPPRPPRKGKRARSAPEAEEIVGEALAAAPPTETLPVPTPGGAPEPPPVVEETPAAPVVARASPAEAPPSVEVSGGTLPAAEPESAASAHTRTVDPPPPLEMPPEPSPGDSETIPVAAQGSALEAPCVVEEARADPPQAILEAPCVEEARESELFSEPAAAPVPRQGPPPDLDALRRRLAMLEARAQDAARRRARLARLEGEAAAYLALAPGVEAALDDLSATMFADVVGVLETALTHALHDVLGQPIALKVEQEWKRGGATMTFHIERAGEREDIMRGQGGSVANILSTGLRIFALARLDPARHRRFLVLDEQDCWLKPDLVPKFVRLVHETGRRLGFQILMISHHDVEAFEDLADRVYRLIPGEDGVRAVRLDAERDRD